MIIKANISEVDIGKVIVGADVRIKLDAYPDTSFAGSIRHISPVGSLQQGRNVVTFNTEVEIIDKDPHLKPGMSCDVDVILAQADSVLYLPIEAVYEKREGSEEDRNETITKIVYVKKGNNPSQVKKKFFSFKKKQDPLDGFVEREIEVGIKSENRIQILADMDTTTVVAAYADVMFTDLENREKAEKGEKVTGANREEGENSDRSLKK